MGKPTAYKEEEDVLESEEGETSTKKKERTELDNKLAESKEDKDIREFDENETTTDEKQIGNYHN